MPRGNTAGSSRGRYASKQGALTEKLVINISPELMDQIGKIARSRELPRSEVVREVLDKAFLKPVLT